MAGIHNAKPSGNAGGGPDFEAQPWAEADKMRGYMDASAPLKMSDWGGKNLRQDVRPAAAASPLGSR